MTAPITTSRIGQRGTQPGLFELGAKVGALNPAPVAPTIPATATPFIAHIYNNAMTSFKTTLTVLNRPKLKWSLNGGFDSITLNTQIDNAGNLYGIPLYGGPLYGGVAMGDVCQLTEQGGDGSVLYTGIVEKAIDTYDNPAVFGLELTPLVAELGDTGFSTNYVTPTDIAQMVRDAVGSTLHLKFNNYTIPDVGQTGVYNFATTNCLDVLNVCRLMAGTNYWWFVDANGYVWFQPMGALAEHSLYQMQHFTSLTRQPDITKQKNSFTVIGGIPSGSTTAMTATYTGSSTATVGKRTIMPPPTFPTVTNQTVLNNLAATIGGVLDRTINRVDMLVNNYTSPIAPNQPGGPMIRYWEPVKYPTQQASTGTGNYSPNYIVLECERDGPLQKLKFGDIPVNNVDDLKYMLDNIVRYWTVNASSVAPPVLQPLVGGTVVGSSGTIVDSTGLVSSGVLQTLANVIASTTSVTGVAAPPTGLGGFGGEAILGSATFSASRQLNVLLMAVCSNYALATTAGGFISADPLYFQLDGVDLPASQATIPVWGSPGNAETRALSATVLDLVTVSPGNHTVTLIWNSQEGSAETCTRQSNSIFVFQVGS